MTDTLPRSRLVIPPPEAASPGARPWSLRWYILWRAVGAVLIVLLVLTALFVAIEVLPGDPARFVLPRGASCAGGGVGPWCALRQTLIAQWGLDKPVWDRYVMFLGNVLTGNLGLSISMNPGVPVWALIAPVLGFTLALLGITLVLAALLAVALGLPLGRRKGSRTDGVVSFLLAIPFSMTAPILALLMFSLLVVSFGIIPMPFGPEQSLAAEAAVVALTLAGVLGLFTWHVRDHPLRPALAPPLAAGDWRQDSTRGASSVRVAVARFLSAVPALTGWTLTTLMMTEVLWAFNGLGLLLWNSIRTMDVFVTMGVVVVAGLLVVLPILIAADILHEWLTQGWVRKDEKSVDRFVVHAEDLWLGLRGLVSRISGIAGIALIAVLAILAVAGPALVGPYPNGLNLSAPNLPPSGAHLLGTDNRGQDVLTLLVYGGSPLIGVAVIALSVSLAAGLGVVAASGLLGSRADVFVVILVDAGLVLPILAVTLAFNGLPGAWGIPLAALVVWPVTTRILLREIQGLVPVRVTSGGLRVTSPSGRTLALIWGAGPLIIGNAFLSVSLALIASTVFDFLGLGAVGPGTFVSWGTMMLTAYMFLDILRGMWWTYVPPALCILAAVLGPTLIGLTVKAMPLGGDQRGSVASEPAAAEAVKAPPL